MDAVERIQAALKKQRRQRGFRGPENEQQLVELLAGDIAASCTLVSQPDEKVQALQAGSEAGNPERKVAIQVDDAFHLCDLAVAKKPKAPAEKPTNTL